MTAPLAEPRQPFSPLQPQVTKPKDSLRSIENFDFQARGSEIGKQADVKALGSRDYGAAQTGLRAPPQELAAKPGKKKTAVEEENDKLLEQLESLGEPCTVFPGETPITANERLRKEAMTAMLKHSFFTRPKSAPLAKPSFPPAA